METDNNNRMLGDGQKQKKRKRGRPKQGETAPESESWEPAEVLMPTEVDNRLSVPPITCPYCQRGTHPQVLRGKTSKGHIPCRTTCCGKRVDYQPAKVRKVD